MTNDELIEILTALRDYVQLVRDDLFKSTEFSRIVPDNETAGAIAETDAINEVSCA